MKIVKASRGTIEQFSTALENKIAEIQQSDVDSSQVVSSTGGATDPLSEQEKQTILDMFNSNSQTVLSTYNSSSEDDGILFNEFNVECDNTNDLHLGYLLDELRNLEQWNIGFDSIENGNGFYGKTYIFFHYPDEEVEGCDKVMADTIPEDDPARVRYLHDLVGFVQNEMDREGLPTNQTIFDTTDDALIITMGGDNVVEFEVPFADLSFDFDRIYEDTDYIVNAMI